MGSSPPDGPVNFPFETSDVVRRLRQVNSWEVMPVLLLLLFSIALSVGMGIVVLVLRRFAGRQPLAATSLELPPTAFQEHPCAFRSPGSWLAIKSRSPLSVQSALGLHNPKPCSWIQGLAGEEKLFIAPPVKGWILVIGSGLPDPSDDVDVCFRFLLDLSRKVGQVQFFSASRVLHYHAWVKADGGRIVRAYAWAGKTLWQQGSRTAAEKELGLKCFDYFEKAEPTAFGQPDTAALNADKVGFLAAKWSIDPGRIDARFLQMERGIAGEPSWHF
jgi:hypothetical protein